MLRASYALNKKDGAAISTAHNSAPNPSSSQTMFSLLAFSFLIFYAVASPVEQLESQPVAAYSPLSYLSPLSSAQVRDACLLGRKNVMQDAKALNQTLVWEIGTIRGSDGEQFCKTVMRMDYDNTWQFAVTDLEWRSHVIVWEPNQAAITLSFNFENMDRVVSCVES
jgi:hypothetical protein